MAKKKSYMPPESSLANLKHIKKGQVLNPEGSRAHDPVKKELKKFTSAYMQEIIELAVIGNMAELKAIADDPNTPTIQVGVARSLFNAVKKGDWKTLGEIVSYLIGKVPDRVQMIGKDGNNLMIEFVKAKHDGDN